MKRVISMCVLLTTLLTAFPANADTALYWEPEARCIYGGGGSYPRMIRLRDGTLLCGFDAALGARNARIGVVRSEDGGKTWSSPIVAAELTGYDCANANFIQLENGDILLAYRAVQSGVKVDAKLLCAVSHDNGFTWEPHSTIIETYGRGGVWEPHFILVGDTVAVFYANDSESAVGFSGQQNIEFKLLEGEGWGEKRIASYGNRTRSRDGMPVVDRLSDGRYVMVVEATSVAGYVFVVQMKLSPDGLDWSAPLKTIYVPNRKYAGKKAGAPYVAVLPGDVLAVSFQTDEDATGSGDGHCTMKLMVSDDLGETWSQPFEPFPMPDGKSAVWNGLYWANDQLFALTSANHPYGGIFARVATLTPTAEADASPLVNPDFAHRSISGWTLTDGVLSWGNNYGAKRYVETEDGLALYLIRNNKNRPLTLTQELSGIPGGAYRFSLRASNAQGEGELLLTLTQHGQEQQFLILPTGEYDVHTVPAIPLTDGSVRLSLTIPADGAQAVMLGSIRLERAE